MPTLKAFKLNSNATYVVTGGFGGLGRAIIQWLTNLGARYFVVPSRSGASSEAAKTLVLSLEGLGVKIMSDKCDISDLQQLQALFLKASYEMPPIRGVIQGAMVLKVKASVS